VSLTSLRTDVAADLVAAGVKAVEYVGETITPPCAVVVPGQPYIVEPSRTNDVPFGHVLVRVDVLLLVAREAAKSAAERIDQLVETAYAALGEHDITQVSRPGLVTLNGAKFVGSTITIEEVTEAP